jgi:hypothetical protein
MDLPGWAPSWCRDHLGAAPVEVLHRSQHMSDVLGVRLDDGRAVAVKSRPDQHGRAATCVEVQRTLAEQGFPAAAPLTGITVHTGVARHAEEWLPGGEIDLGDDMETAERFARLLARMITLAADVEVGGAEPGAVAPPLPNPEWVRWDDEYPPEPGLSLPDHLVDAFDRVRVRMAGMWLPRVLGHADWESQNLRWRGPEPYAVHDWDSLAWLPEAALAGAASGAFASSGPPTLAPLASSVAFLDAYQEERGRRFDDQEIEIAWAAGLWLALHNARAEILRDEPPVAQSAVLAQAGDRLELAGA